MQISSLDHLVLTVRDMDKTIQFYTEVLGMALVIFGNNRKALAFGAQKINLHQWRQEHEPKAHQPTPGSADLCFLTQTPIAEVMSNLKAKHIELVEGPVQRTGASGPIMSVYVRDPDLNLIEVSNQLNH